MTDFAITLTVYKKSISNIMLDYSIDLNFVSNIVLEI